MFYSFCRLRERFVRAEHTDKLLCLGVLGAEPLNILPNKRLILKEPFRCLEDCLESREVPIVDELDQLLLYLQLIFFVELWILRGGR